MESLTLSDTDFLFRCIEQLIHRYGSASVPQEIFQSLLLSVYINLYNYNGTVFMEFDERIIKVTDATLDYVLVQ